MKKIMAWTLVVVFTLGFTVTATAAEVTPRGAGFGRGICWEVGVQYACYNFFWDEDGNFLSRESVEVNLNNAVENGEITAAQRDLLLERYEFCAAYGGGAAGVWCGGFGRGFNDGEFGRRFNGRGRGMAWQF